MNDEERAICARLREFREAARWPQSIFAEQIGITLDQLASYEYGRTPIRFETALKIAKRAGVGLRWLAEGVGIRVEPIRVDPRILGEIPAQILFSEAWKNHLKRPFEFAEQQAQAWLRAAEKAEISSEELDSLRREYLSYLEEDFGGLLHSAPPYLFHNLYAHICSSLRDFIAMNRGALNEWDSKFREQQQKRLTQISQKGKSSSMQSGPSELQKLIQEVKRKASAPGAKSELARKLGVAPARITEWLSGKKEPGGEYTLRLENWVYGPRRH